MMIDGERRRPWGFVIPLAIYIAISFPPLIGQEVVASAFGAYQVIISAVEYNRVLLPAM